MKFLLFALLLLTSCNFPSPMTNDQIITETKKCRDAGLEARPLYTNDDQIVKIQCMPKKDK